MTDLQDGSVHYFQRPDQDYMHVDSAATSLAGFGGRLVAEQAEGPDAASTPRSAAINPGLELNDVGFAPRTDHINSHVVAGYRWTKPTSVYQRVNFNVATFGVVGFRLGPHRPAGSSATATFCSTTSGGPMPGASTTSRHGEHPWHSRRAGHAAARRISTVRCRLQLR